MLARLRTLSVETVRELQDPTIFIGIHHNHYTYAAKQPRKTFPVHCITINLNADTKHTAQS